MKRAYGVLALLLLAVVGLRVLTLYTGQKDDKSMIQESLRQALEAGRQGKAGGVLDLLSNSLTVNQQSTEGNISRVADFIRKQKPDVTVPNQQPIVTGDEARIISPVTVKTSLPIIGDKTFTLKDVVLVFKKETAREYLVFPVSKWRLTEVQAPADAFSQLSFE